MIASLPLGAGRLTRELLPGDPPSAEDVKALRKHVRTEVARRPAPVRDARASRTTRSRPRRRSSSWPGSPAPRRRRRARSCRGCSPSTTSTTGCRRLAEMSYDERAELPGVSAGRAPQLLAGAVVAEAVLDLLDLEEVQVCPWALREGIILRRIDWMRGEPDHLRRRCRGRSRRTLG